MYENSKKDIIEEHGINFNNMFVTSPLCCPSRSSILTGLYAHNSYAINNSITGGCSSLYWQQNQEKATFAAVLHKMNYTTFYAGKYLNQYGTKAAGGTQHVPDGWDWWNGLVGNSVYYNYTLSVNGTAVKHGDNYETDYLTDVIDRKATEFLEFQSSKEFEQPFMMMLATPASHHPFTPAPQYEKYFLKENPYRLPSFGVYGNDKHWLLRQVSHPMSHDAFEYINNTFHARWQTLQSVDDMVANVAKRLEWFGVLDNTYIIFTSDNGFHLGQFSLPNDKRQLYEFDVRVPLMVRGPGIEKHLQSDAVALNIDLAPTIIDLAGGLVPENMDGISLKNVLFGKPNNEFARDSFTIEHSGESDVGIPDACIGKRGIEIGAGLGVCKPDCVCEDASNNTYVCIRTLNLRRNDMYCKFMDSEGFEEQYDLNDDPYQLANKASTLSSKEKNLYLRNLIHGSICSGDSCRRMNSEMMDKFT